MDDTTSVTFSTDTENVIAILDKKRLRIARVLADKIFNDIALKFGKSEHAEMYFYAVLALYEQARDTISFIGPNNMKLGLEV